MDSLDKFLRLDINYPGIDIKVELIAIQEYIQLLDAGVDKICETYISEEMKEYRDAEYYEYQHIYALAEDEIPRLIRMPFAISIYSLFENSVNSLLLYAKDKENKELSHKDISGRSKVSIYNKYLKHVLSYDFSFNDNSVQALSAIYKIRNVAAHANGSLIDMDKQSIKKLEKVIGSVQGVESNGRYIVISTEYLNYSFSLVESTLLGLMGYMEERYGFSAST
ncbi:MAG: hypothetical protein COA78_25670 [Blastopirellula sp.]|nr:MAG: hypothetical protein COA78_25670 [Blastopirellula sp.]